MQAAWVIPRYPVPKMVSRSSAEELRAGTDGHRTLPALKHRQRLGRFRRVIRQIYFEKINGAHVVVSDGLARGGEPARLHELVEATRVTKVWRKQVRAGPGRDPFLVERGPLEHGRGNVPELSL